MEVPLRQWQPPPLPEDLLLEIIARCDDVATVVRSAACSKSLRGAILEPGFHHRLRLRAASHGGFDPSLLVASCYRLSVNGPVVVVRPPSASSRLGSDATPAAHQSLMQQLDPGSSRDGLLVLRRRDSVVAELSVCNTLTGGVTPLPPIDQGLGRRCRAVDNKLLYRPALLSVAGAGRSFELVAMYRYYKAPNHGFGLATRTFSSPQAEWSAAREVHLPTPPFRAVAAPPVVVGRTVHWLCRITGGLMVLALDADSALATVIDLPKELTSAVWSTTAGARPSYYPSEGSVILAATAEGTKLSMVVAEKCAVISTWTAVQQGEEGSSSASSVRWSRQVVIRRWDICRQLSGRENDLRAAFQPVRFSAFGERSGTVLFWIYMVGLVQLNLGTKKAVLLWKWNDEGYNDDSNARAFLKEIDLVSLLQCMKPPALI